ncbi:hypothetical protein [Sansalvadorimonas verongulae]|uniref:hypothetical protein n=1 Tax=Sansalvadorimonas verongulae TaxID=2172824 RepID=UPI0012BC2576|nr:hypothetical protein [Sansalvadorimonas verongulae]MTI12615.1 hypothetical protein [Sansalvadorimonas verongulae]
MQKPWPSQPDRSDQKVYFSSYVNQPKQLDPVRAYSSDGGMIIDQIFVGMPELTKAIREARETLPKGEWLALRFFAPVPWEADRLSRPATKTHNIS